MRKLLSLVVAAIKGSEEDLTTISINRAIILLAVPMILEMVMESLFAVVDIYFVGKISEEAIGVVGLTESVLMIVYSLAIGLMTKTSKGNVICMAIVILKSQVFQRAS